MAIEQADVGAEFLSDVAANSRGVHFHPHRALKSAQGFKLRRSGHCEAACPSQAADTVKTYVERRHFDAATGALRPAQKPLWHVFMIS